MDHDPIVVGLPIAIMNDRPDWAALLFRTKLALVQPNENAIEVATYDSIHQMNQNLPECYTFITLNPTMTLHERCYQWHEFEDYPTQPEEHDYE
jgi:hypothetical protein